MDLSEEVKDLIERVNEANLQRIETYPPAEARVEFRRRMKVLEIPPCTIFKSIDINIPSDSSPIHARLYLYSEDISDPLAVFAHGGGWVLGGIEEYDSFCRRLSNFGKCAVLSVGYRLAPENPHPAGLQDVMSAFSYVPHLIASQNISPKRILGVGDSAGGNLIANSSILLEKKVRPTQQILIYPVIDVTKKRGSYQKFGKGFLLDSDMMDWFINSYVGNSELEDPSISVILSKNLSLSPTTFILTAGLDPLQDEAIDYVDELKKNSVSVIHSHYESMLHGFLGMPKALSLSKNAFCEIGDWIYNFNTNNKKT